MYQSAQAYSYIVLSHHTDIAMLLSTSLLVDIVEALLAAAPLWFLGKLELSGHGAGDGVGEEAGVSDVEIGGVLG